MGTFVRRRGGHAVDAGVAPAGAWFEPLASAAASVATAAALATHVRV